MFQHLTMTNYKMFKENSYRIKRFRDNPVKEIEDVVQLGYLDVNRTLHGISKFNEQSKLLKSKVSEFISNLLAKPPKNQGDYDKIHDECCSECCQIRNGIDIRYGQAQKVVNMSLKYLYNEYAFYQEKKYLGFTKERIEIFFHLPIDRYVLAYFKKYHKLAIDDIRWSLWEKKQYVEFQEKLKQKLIGGYFPLEIDYIIWRQKEKVTDKIINDFS